MAPRHFAMPYFWKKSSRSRYRASGDCWSAARLNHFCASSNPFAFQVPRRSKFRENTGRKRLFARPPSETTGWLRFRFSRSHRPLAGNCHKMTGWERPRLPHIGETNAPPQLGHETGGFRLCIPVQASAVRSYPRSPLPAGANATTHSGFCLHQFHQCSRRTGRSVPRYSLVQRPFDTI
jgi:hypothetical protein